MADAQCPICGAFVRRATQGTCANCGTEWDNAGLRRTDVRPLGLPSRGDGDSVHCWSGHHRAAEVAYSAGGAEERAAVAAMIQQVEFREALYASFSDDLRSRLSQNTLRAVLGALADRIAERGADITAAAEGAWSAGLAAGEVRALDRAERALREMAVNSTWPARDVGVIERCADVVALQRRGERLGD